VTKELAPVTVDEPEPVELDVDEDLVPDVRVADELVVVTGRELTDVVVVDEELPCEVAVRVTPCDVDETMCIAKYRSS
jgi:hypothetical protein